MISAPFSKNQDYEITPAGNHIARVYSIIHIGVVQGEYMGEYKETDTVRLGFELPSELMNDGRPFSIFQEYTLSMHEKAKLRPIVEGIIGQGLLDQDAESFDVTDLMGRTCMVNVIHETSAKGNKYAKIAGTAPLPKGIKAPEPVNEPFLLDYEEQWSEEKFSKQPQFIREKMAGTRNYKNKFNVKEPIRVVEVIEDDGIPF